VQRRKLLAGISSIGIGAAGLVAFSQEATPSATVSTNDLSIPDREYAQTAELQDVKIRVDADYSFESAEVPDRWILSLLVSSNGSDYSQIAEDRMAPTEKQNAGTKELTGSIISTEQFDISQFRVEDSTKSEVIYTKLVFDVQIDEESIAKATATDTAQLTVTPGDVEASSTVSGTGEIVLEK
jgi:hypothetical protein